MPLLGRAKMRQNSRWKIEIRSFLRTSISQQTRNNPVTYASNYTDTHPCTHKRHKHARAPSNTAPAKYETSMCSEDRSRKLRTAMKSDRRICDRRWPTSARLLRRPSTFVSMEASFRNGSAFNKFTNKSSPPAWREL